MYDENAGIEAKCRSKYELNPFFICRDSGSILDTIAREDLLLVPAVVAVMEEHGAFLTI